MGNIVPVFQNPGATASWLAKLQPQMALALPKHLNVDRMTRLVLTAFSTNPKLAECTPHSVAASVMTAAQLGLEPNVNGQGYLVPYGNTCTFVPGWKGLVDLANRGGRCTVWTGAVYKGDDFDYQLGDNPYVRHRKGDDVDELEANLLFVYACGRIKGQDMTVSEVWTKAKVLRHRDKFNKVGKRHYSFDNLEMYARKVPLLQVLKYMPQSIELTAAMHAVNASEEGRTINIDGATWVSTDNPPDPGNGDAGGDDRGSNGSTSASPPAGAAGNGKPPLTAEELTAKKPSLLKALQAGQKVNDVITALEIRNSLTPDQKMEVAGWVEAPKTTTEGAAK